MADFCFLFGWYYVTYYICSIMAKIKIRIEKPQEAKVVKSYRIKQVTFDKADSLSNQKYGKGVAAIIEQLIENHFSLNPKKK
jgi:hypothetical protein